MSTIFPTGVLSGEIVTWTPGAYVLAPSPPATITGSPNAAFVSAGAGAETISIALDGAAPIVVTSLGTEAVVADWVTTINATPGLAGVASVNIYAGLRLSGTTAIAVTAYGGTGGADVAWAVVGLPIVTRTVGVPVAILRPDVWPSLQMLSDAVAVPIGARKLSLVATIGPGGGSISLLKRVMFAVAWEISAGLVSSGGAPYGTAGVDQVEFGPAGIAFDPFLIPDTSITLDVPAAADTIAAPVRADLMSYAIQSWLMSPAVPLYFNLPVATYDVPAATAMRVFAWMRGAAGGAFLLGTPSPPELSIKAFFGA